MTQGMKTSEFWLALGGQLIGLALVLLGVFRNQQTLVELGVMLLGGAGVGFAVSRGLAKINQPALPAPTPVVVPATDKAAAGTVANIGG